MAPPKNVVEAASASSRDSDVVGLHLPPAVTNKRVCPHCKREFKNGKALGGHIKIHFKDRRRTRSSKLKKNRVGQNLLSPLTGRTSVYMPTFHAVLGHVNDSSCSTSIAAASMEVDQVVVQENREAVAINVDDEVANGSIDQNVSNLDPPKRLDFDLNEMPPEED
ncbi:Zinc finger C2H2-type [Sesbania bispinosa]|nr:Zinc finger C2H2-type [Sesbania bispinosa]